MALTHHSLQVIKFSTSLTTPGAGILPVQPGVFCRTALSVSYSKLPTPANLSGLQKHPHGQHQKTPNPTPHQCTLPETAMRTPARSARRFLFLSLNLYVLLPSPAQPGNLSNLPNRRLQSPPGNFRFPHMYDKSCQSRASLMGAKWQRQQGGVSVDTLPICSGGKNNKPPKNSCEAIALQKKQYLNASTA